MERESVPSPCRDQAVQVLWVSRLRVESGSVSVPSPCRAWSCECPVSVSSLVLWVSCLHVESGPVSVPSPCRAQVNVVLWVSSVFWSYDGPVSVSSSGYPSKAFLFLRFFYADIQKTDLESQGRRESRSLLKIQYIQKGMQVNKKIRYIYKRNKDKETKLQYI